MKPKPSLDMEKIAQGLGAARRGKVDAGGRCFGAMQLAAEVLTRFRSPPGAVEARIRRGLSGASCLSLRERWNGSSRSRRPSATRGARRSLRCRWRRCCWNARPTAWTTAASRSWHRSAFRNGVATSAVLARRTPTSVTPPTCGAGTLRAAATTDRALNPLLLIDP